MDRRERLKNFIRASLDHNNDGPEVEAALNALEKKDRAILELVNLMAILGDEVHRERFQARQAELEGVE